MNTNYIGNKWIVAIVLGWFVVGLTPAFAMDLNEHCTVNIMNRTVQAQANGSWRMNNVPSFMGRVRARATCVRDGVTTSGQSAFFNLTANNLNIVEDIFFDEPDPVPVSLSFETNGEIVFTDTSTNQLQVRAVYGDGSSSPLLNASNGINFSSSNSNIVSVDNNGLLTPLSSGRVIITARLEGAVVVRQVRVSLSGDMDGDGLPDSYEVDNGLDPNDPVDAREDRDNDGLNALEEFNLGTDVNSSDTDGDGITDGEEVVAGVDGYITNPVLADTDGDGFSDGLEIDLSTDPSDSLSFDLVNALESITVSPSTLNLIFNGVDTEVSDQITVLGNLIDGKQLDITSSSFGTTYSSSDLTIASFGTTDGEVFGGVAGSTTVTANNNGYSDSIAVNVERFDPVALSAIAIPGYANNVDVQGNYAYVAAGSAGLVIVDVSDRTAPFIVSQLDTDGTAIDVKVSGDIVYLADGQSGIKIIDVVDPLLPVLISTLDTDGFAQDIDVDSNYLYVADGDNGLVVVSIVQPDAPFIQSSLSGIGRVKGVAVELNRIAIASTAGLVLVDASDIGAPQEMSRMSFLPIEDVLIQGDFVYTSSYTTGYRIINASDFANPAVIAGNRQFLPGGAAIQDDLILYATLRLINSIIPYVNISDPENAVFQGVINLSGLGNYSGRGIAVDNQYTYVTEELLVTRNDYGISGNTRLSIAQYQQITDDRGQAPAVNIISPEPNDVIIQGAMIAVEVNAQDDLAVKEVEFSVNGEVVFLDTKKPYRMRLTVASDTTELLLSARAIDWGGNQSTTAVTLSVQLDTDDDGLGDGQELNEYFTQIDNPDSDNDNLSDYREVLLRTNPNQADTDGDGIDDGDENGNGTNPLLPDTDDDGLSDAEEISLQTDPLKSDTDGDGLRDGDEANLYNTDPLRVDTDIDGLTDGFEVNEFNTNPLKVDTDNDGFDDDLEFLIGSDPNAPQDDIDNDGLPNDQEGKYGANSIKADTDNDGLLDGIEVSQRTSPAIKDTDRDGVDDGQDTVNDWYLFWFSSSTSFGSSVGNAGDVDNDGVTDIIVGAPRDNFRRGRVSIYSGRDRSLIYSVSGSSTNDHLGTSVSGIGDINDDGYADVIVGVPEDDSNGTNSGSAVIYSGKDQSVLHTLTGDSAYSYFGGTVANAGDVDADGVDDIVVGTTREGTIKVFSGADLSVIHSFTGRSVSAAGDVNNDGFSDIVVGNNNDGRSFGTAVVYSGADASVLHSFINSDRTLNGDRFGSNVSGVGDVNNDGFADVSVSSSDFNDGSGRASGIRVFSGVDGSTLYTFYSESYYSLRIAKGVGDINKDGYADIAIGGNTNLNDPNGGNAGTVRVLSGADGSVIYTLHGYGANDLLGSSIEALGDVDNDGYPDIVVGASSDQSIRVVSSNADWDNDGFPTLFDPYPLIYMDATTDYDMDGLLDFDELNLTTDPLHTDTDGDGVNDGDEVNTYQSNPKSIDSDGDGLSDGYEQAEGLNLTDASDALLDKDNDGLNNLLEFTIGTEASNTDSDGDGLPDGTEYFSNKTYPTVVDTDNDGLNDAEDTINEWHFYIRASDGRYVFPVGVGDVNSDGVPDFMTMSNYDVPRGGARGEEGYYLYSGADRSLIHEFEARGIYSAAGDINNDGYDDLLMHDPQGLNAQGIATGKVLVISGFDRSVLYEFYGLNESDGFGRMAKAADMDNDGIPDIIISAPRDNTLSVDGGVMYIYSGSSGALLRQIDSGRLNNIQEKFAIGDVNNDGYNDIVINYEPNEVDYGQGTGFIEIVIAFSGMDGSVIKAFVGEFATNFGSSLSLADIDGDGHADIIVGANGRDYDVSRKHSGSIIVYSGKTYQILQEWLAEDFGYGSPQNFGSENAVNVVGDINEDSFPDIAFVALDQLYLYSGKDRSLLYVLDQRFDGDFVLQNRYVTAVADMDQDGASDFAVVDNQGNIKIVSGNGDWDGDGLRTLADPYPLIFMNATSDYDADGLTDFDEINTYSTDPLNSDSDMDSLSDGEEVNTYSSNPLSSDSDADGISDGYEVANGLNIIDGADANEDKDNDGLNNLLEFTLGSLANNIDSDNDGLADSDEYLGKTSLVHADTDGDGVDDGQDTIDDWYYYIRPSSTDSTFNKTTVAYLKDINNDSVDDIIFGFTDRLDIVSGSSGLKIHRMNLPSAIATARSIADVGDVNNDGINDFAFALQDSSSSMDGVSAVVYSGADTSILTTFSEFRVNNKRSVYNFGDINSDGISDITIKGTFFNIYSGQNNSVLYNRVSVDSYASLGDINSDGNIEIVSGNEDAGGNGFNAGYVGVNSLGGSFVYAIQGVARNYRFGRTVDAIGDIDDDGIVDFVAGAPGYNTGRGAVYFYSGASGDFIGRVSGRNVGSGFGSNISRAGDVDNDGYQDVIIAESYDDTNGLNAGKVTVISGKTRSILYTLYGQTGDLLGDSVSVYTDIDNDGYDDILVGGVGNGGHLRVISSNADWDNDGVNTLDDAFPLDPTRQ